MFSRCTLFCARSLLLPLPVALLAGCATLPSSGPTAAEVKRGAGQNASGLQFRIVDIDAPTLKQVELREAAADAAVPTLESLAITGQNDVVGPGDVLSIGIYEVGITLFGQPRDNAAGFDPGARGEPFPQIVVDRDGAIHLPYVGSLQVAGRTPTEIAGMIEAALKGKSQNPQALVGVVRNVSSTVYVAGDVKKPGRLDLSLQHERLLDAIALSGGTANSAEDTVVRFNRGGRTIEERLGRISPGAADDLVLIPGDRIEIITRPLTLIVMGATGKVSQMPFQTGKLSLVEAVARAGGPNDIQADPSAIFLFRYDTDDATTGGEKPIIYRLNLMNPASYFLSQRFAMRDKDVIFIANAASNRPAKLVAIINQLFSPLVTARALTGN